METEIRVRKKYQITLPAVIREAAGVYEGDLLTARVQADHSILLRPTRLVDAGAAPADEAFFYTPEWQAAEREADEDIRLGRLSEPMSAEETIAELHRLVAESESERARCPSNAPLASTKRTSHSPLLSAPRLIE
ncbi:MAG: AbrB/MazE/SpoVT family DNA-binding domain-containing protein [Chloroflexota bacterium]|nr:AbrB/MazE/SpoVT family DNA-binding domain-containing protein [Chloroflexota bacterium]